MTERFEGNAYGWTVWSLWRREVVRFLRQRSRIVGALGTPVVFWVLIGSGLGRSFRPTDAAESVHYLEYAFPGTIVLIVLFTAIFSMISVIEDRQAGFLQSVLVAPVDRTAIVMGKVLGSTTLAVAQAGLFLVAGPIAGLSLTPASVILTLGLLVLIGIGLAALGFLIAWPMDSTQGFHAVMNLFLIPMWLLSGAFFPASGASYWLRGVMTINPLTYAVSALRQTLYYGTSRAQPSHDGMSLSIALAVTAVFAVSMVVLSARSVALRRSD